MDGLPAIAAPKLKSASGAPIAAAAAAKPEPVIGTNDGEFFSSNERLTERRKIRHTFDILADQLLSLREIAVAREKSFGRRALLGELVQEALDLFIAKERNKE